MPTTACTMSSWLCSANSPLAPKSRRKKPITKAALASPGAMQAALTSGKVKIEKGDPAALAAFLELFRG